MLEDSKLSEIPDLGFCTKNPDGDAHEFIDLGERFGTLRFRCRHCQRSEAEIRDSIAETR